MVAPSKKAAPVKKAVAQLSKDRPGQLRKPAERVFKVLARSTGGNSTVHSVRATSEAEALKKVRAIIAHLPDWDVVDIAAGG